MKESLRNAIITILENSSNRSVEGCTNYFKIQLKNLFHSERSNAKDLTRKILDHLKPYLDRFNRDFTAPDESHANWYRIHYSISVQNDLVTVQFTAERNGVYHRGQSSYLSLSRVLQTPKNSEIFFNMRGQLKQDFKNFWKHRLPRLIPLTKDGKKLTEKFQEEKINLENQKEKLKKLRDRKEKQIEQVSTEILELERKIRRYR